MATWNLRHCWDPRSGRVDIGVVAAAIAGLEVDVLAVQEIDRGLPRSGGIDQVTELAMRLGWRGLFAPTMLLDHRGALVGGRDGSDNCTDRGDDGSPAYGIGLLSRHPLQQRNRIVLSSGPRDGRTAGGRLIDREPRVALPAVMTMPFGDVAVLATHLSWPPWQALSQLRRALTLTACVKMPIALAGDLNLPARVLGRVLAGRGWRAATAGPTFPARRPCLQLDHILAHDAQPADVRTDYVGLSDHRIVSATIVIDRDRSSSGDRSGSWSAAP
ncbi:endonuclease/exonuclease/phosphatase family protein [Pseudonocardia alaniniphila]|uniref:Endonuclease/exonuclease/phosphatase family protein n=1 Tax=Pseudonocardia alaniniphila TaxID=75291 RepID=A0ABS9TUE9_9PSEU|nr:endonuclease/exonuclease/phosphatase family protein [Pseudonocardia alaniniphila]MCH6171968.1 endonuclease/exonuclease/phosphatase family protein [Pseudonocardia alaniniphila]